MLASIEADGEARGIATPTATGNEAVMRRVKIHPA